ncbi:hypothetical protein [Pseudomonas syringae]|uniref:Uncharacterized protein n=1 Tax=Pseudomonas syringae TaxID=317 RepID=A0A085VNY4_PSESX|nr:hypothetical protein [Pseudomonas syringae]KFE57147.1 hypothetical protein IV01_05570 [Pseudomonas syringae]
MTTDVPTAVSPPLELKRITTEMHDLEDRMQLTGELTSGEPVVLWMTQRLVKRLVPHLLTWLQPAAPTGKSAVVADYHTAAVQSFAQQAALAQLPEQSAVQATPQHSAWLIETIDVTRTEEIIALTFKSGEQQATLLMAPQPLRQWLAILHDQCVKGEWALEIWPEWILDSIPTGGPKLNATMH